MPQNYEDQLDLSMTPVDFLDSTGEKSERTKIRTYLGSLKYTADEMDHPIRELSGGQKAKVLLLKMSLGNANVLILDEPTRNFSPLSGPVIRKMLREFPGAIISISHDRKYIGEVCGKEYLLEKDGLRLIREKIKIFDTKIRRWLAVVFFRREIMFVLREGFAADSVPVKSGKMLILY